MKKVILLLCVVFCISFASCSNSNVQPESTTEPVQIETTVEVVPVIEYDALQRMFITFTLNTTEEDVMNLINEYGLEYSSKEYNGTPKSIKYKIAYDKGVTPQRYADSGDHNTAMLLLHNSLVVCYALLYS